MERLEGYQCPPQAQPMRDTDDVAQNRGKKIGSAIRTRENPRYDHALWIRWGDLRKVAYCPELTAATGSLSAGVLLSQIMYWWGPAKNGETKLRVVKDGQLWLAKSRQEWQDETGLTFKRLKNAKQKLIALGVIEERPFRFSGMVIGHIKLNLDGLEVLLEQQGLREHEGSHLLPAQLHEDD